MSTLSLKISMTTNDNKGMALSPLCASPMHTGELAHVWSGCMLCHGQVGCMLQPDHHTACIAVPMEGSLPSFAQGVANDLKHHRAGLYNRSCCMWATNKPVA